MSLQDSENTMLLVKKKSNKSSEPISPNQKHQEYRISLVFISKFSHAVCGLTRGGSESTLGVWFGFWKVGVPGKKFLGYQTLEN